LNSFSYRNELNFRQKKGNNNSDKKKFNQCTEFFNELQYLNKKGAKAPFKT